jgi:deoxyribonuclease IV
MLANGRRIGAHLPLGEGMVKAADRAAEIGASAIQVFTDNPTAWRRRPTLPDELPDFRARLAAHDVAPIAIHAPYLINLAGPEPAFYDQSIVVLANELRVARAYGAAFVNVHVGSHRDAGPEAGVARLADGLAHVLALAEAAGDTSEAATDAKAEDDDDGDAGTTPLLLLENGSGGGFGLGARIEELAGIEAATLAVGIGRDRFGYCLDTAHLWGAGYPIDTAEGVDAVIEAFDAALGIDRLVMVHLNDSRSERGSLADRHEHVGAGRIGGAGLARMLTHPALDHVVYMLETPGMEDGYDAVNVARAKALAAGMPIEDLPPEAFATRRAKGRSAPPDPEGNDPAAIALAKAQRPRRTPRPAATPPPARD